MVQIESVDEPYDNVLLSASMQALIALSDNSDPLILLKPVLSRYGKYCNHLSVQLQLNISTLTEVMCSVV